MSDQKVLFVSIFNLGCIDIAENHLYSLKKSGIENYMAYVTDNESFQILSSKGYNVKHYALDIIKEKQEFGTEQFNNISYLRYIIINQLLKEGKIVWYLDVDTVVLYNLNELIPLFISNKYDLVMQNDITDPCSGCMLFCPNSKTIALIECVYNNRTPMVCDQFILAQILKQNIFNINLHLLETTYFPNGLLYFNERHPDPKFKLLHDDFKKSNDPVYFVHANWMVGVDTKIEALKSKGLWFIA